MNHYISIHFETCGLPSVASPIVLDALLFDQDGTPLDRFCVVMKPHDHFTWDSSADKIHGIAEPTARGHGYTYAQTKTMFNQWIDSMTQDVTLVFYDKDTTVALSTMVKGTVDVFHFLGNKRLPISEALDLQMIVAFYIHRAKMLPQKEIKFSAPVTHVLSSWNVQTDESVWVFVQGGLQFRSRAMAYKIHQCFMMLFKAGGN